MQRIILVHAVLACVAFVALFPIGGILIRVATFTGCIWVHVALQSFAHVIYLAAFGLGIYLANSFGQMSEAHAIIGIALFMILLGQPLFGYLHHKMFKKYGHRTFWSYMHLWHGRVAVLLGIVNGGLGIQLAGNVPKSRVIAYSVIAAIMGLAYIAAIFIGEWRGKRNTPPSYDNSQKARQMRDVGSSEENVSSPEYYGKRNYPQAQA